MGVRWILEQASRVQKVQLDYFSLDTGIILLTALGTAVAVIPIAADSDFALYQITGMVYSAPATIVAAWNGQVSFVDQGSGRALQNAPVPWLDTVGTAQLPYVLPEAKFFNGNGGIQATITDISNVVVSVRITFTGVKIFYKAGASRVSLMQGAV